MRRLTFHNSDGTWGLIHADIKKVPKNLYGCMCKLKDYEDTQLDPSDIEMVKDMYDDMVERCQWTDLEEKVPEYSDELMLIVCNGQYGHIHFKNAIQLATYCDEGWILESYPEADVEVLAWMKLPPTYRRKNEKD